MDASPAGGGSRIRLLAVHRAWVCTVMILRTGPSALVQRNLGLRRRTNGPWGPQGPNSPLFPHPRGG